MKFLEKKIEHERDKFLTFNEEKHEYYYKSDNFISVTTYISKIFKDFDTEECIKNLMGSRDWVKHELYGKSKEEIIDIWKKRNEEAIQKGIELHQNIENYLNNISVENSSIEFQYFQKFLNEHNNLSVYRTEWPIFDEDLKLAGTIDMCSINPDKSLTLYDWKRTKSIRKTNYYKNFSVINYMSHIEDTNFNHYSLQLNLYKYILEKKYKKKVKKMYLVCLHPENKNKDYIIYNVDYKPKDIELVLKYIKENN